MTPTPETVVTSYMIAHGMARGAVMSGGMSLQTLAQLVMTDHRTLLAVARAASSPDSRNLQQANEAIERLIALTTPPDTINASPRMNGQTR